MAAAGTASALIVRLWLDHGLAPADTLDCPPAVFATLIATLHHRHEARQGRAAAEDRNAAEMMHSIIPTVTV